MFRRHEQLAGIASATIVRRRPSLDFSVTGVVFIGMMLFLGMAAINSQANLLFGVFGLMIGILLVSGVASRLVLRRLCVRRVLPEHSRVGHPTTLLYEITNAKKFWPSLSIVIAELDGAEGFTKQPQAYMLHAAPRTAASVPALVIPKRRGLLELNRYQLGTSFPFGFIKRAATERRRDMLLIYPPAADVSRELLSLCRSADPTGETMRPRPGGADEFYGVREYRPGDNPRWIYWRRSARSGTLVSKEMTRVAPPRLVLLVDTHLTSRSIDEHRAVEQCIAMATSLAAVALDQGLAVGLCAWCGHWVAVQPTRGKRHRADLLSVLSRLPLNAGHQLDQLIQRSQEVLQAGTTPVLFTPRGVQPGPAGHGRMIVIASDSAHARGWFHFAPSVDFASCMPADQQPRGNKDAETRRRGDAEKTQQAPVGAAVPASPRPRVSASSSKP